MLTNIIDTRYNLEKRGDISLKLKRLQKMSYFLHIALKILSVGSIMMCLAALATKFLNWGNVTINTNQENTDIFAFFHAESFYGSSPEQYAQINESIMLGVVSFSLILLALILWIASMVFKDLANKFIPFSDTEIARLRRISQLLLIYSLVPQMLYAVLHTILIPGYYISFGLNMSFFFAIIFYCLTEIFRYGAFLQKESDETL